MTAAVQGSGTSGAGAAVAMRTVGVWRTVLGCEWRLLRADAGWWLAIVVLLACTSYALFSGQQRLQERAASVASARQDETRRLQQLQEQLERLQAGGAPYVGESFRDPGNALAVGRGAAAPVLAFDEAPLSVLAVGLSDLYPPSFKVAVGSRDRFLFVDEIANPSALAAGSFDVAFVLVVLFPLLLLAMSYNVLSGEREAGTLALTMASSAPLQRVLWAKLALRGGGITLALLAALGVGLAWTARGPLAAWLPSALLLAAAVLLYAVFWLALALWVNSWGRDSGFNAVALVVAWLLLLLVLPAAINAVSSVVHPAPARAEMVLSVRQAGVDAERDRAAEQERFRAEHGMSRPSGSPGDAQRRAVALLLTADQRADQVLDRHEGMARDQRALSDRLAWLAPPMRMNDLVAELAGNGHTRWDAQMLKVAEFHDRWQRHFVDIAQRGDRLSLSALQQRPVPGTDQLAAWSEAGSTRVITTLGWLALCCGLLLILAARGLWHAI